MNDVKIKGFIPTSLIDYPGKICSVIFLPDCNFRCPFCQNPELILNQKDIPDIEPKKILANLSSRRKWIDGVCITGGEPMLHAGLPDLASKIKDMGFLVKIDTNGTNPEMLKNLIEKKLVDYIAMDIKSPFEDYEKAAGVRADIKKLKESLRLIIESDIDHEMRSTILPKLHEKKGVVKIAKEIKKAKRYVLQQFRSIKTLDPEFRNCESFTKEELESIRDECNKYVPTELRA